MLQMRLRGHLIGATAWAVASIAIANSTPVGTDAAAADQLLAELSDLSQLHTARR
jgi:hypothetical protein